MRRRASGLENRPFSLWVVTLLLHGGLLLVYDPHRQLLTIAAVILHERRGAGSNEALRGGDLTSTPHDASTYGKRPLLPLVCLWEIC